RPSRKWCASRSRLRGGARVNRRRRGEQREDAGQPADHGEHPIASIIQVADREPSVRRRQANQLRIPVRFTVDAVYNGTTGSHGIQNRGLARVRREHIRARQTERANAVIVRRSDRRHPSAPQELLQFEADARLEERARMHHFRPVELRERGARIGRPELRNGMRCDCRAALAMHFGNRLRRGRGRRDPRLDACRDQVIPQPADFFADDDGWTADETRKPAADLCGNDLIVRRQRERFDALTPCFEHEIPRPEQCRAGKRAVHVKVRSEDAITAHRYRSVNLRSIRPGAGGNRDEQQHDRGDRFHVSGPASPSRSTTSGQPAKPAKYTNSADHEMARCRSTSRMASARVRAKASWKKRTSIEAAHSAAAKAVRSIAIHELHAENHALACTGVRNDMTPDTAISHTAHGQSPAAKRTRSPAKEPRRRTRRLTIANDAPSNSGMMTHATAPPRVNRSVKRPDTIRETAQPRRKV